MIHRRLVLGAVLATLGLFANVAGAHELRSAVLRIDEVRPGVFEVAWTVTRPVTAARMPAPLPELPASCEPLGPKRQASDGSVERATWRVDCGPGRLRGEHIGLGRAGAEAGMAFLQVTWLDGAQLAESLHAGRPFVRVPMSEAGASSGSPADIALRYARLGAEHIGGGYDHLLFVIALVLLLRRPGPIVKAVTGFTIGHSATLALAATGLVRLPAAPVEALISLSIVYVAADLAQPKPTAVTPDPRWMPAGFGLLHGFGFAGALVDVGLPETHLPIALFGFNVGVELGQLAVVVVAALLVQASRALFDRGRRATVCVAYAIGTVATFWTFDRVSFLWAA